MRNRRLPMLLLTLLIGLLLAGTGSAAETVMAGETRSNGCPYFIMVNRTQNTVTVYGLDDAGCYTVPVRAMVCSTARYGYATPLGTYSVTGLKNEWNYMRDGTWGQYSVQFYGNYLFHSVCYSQKDPSTLITAEYNALGSPASMGCVRLQVADAKWIYDNCAAGTLVTVYESDDPGPLGKPQIDWIAPADDCGWEPTDPRAENPWHYRTLTDFTLSATTLALEAGQQQLLIGQKTPANASPPISWSTDNPAVAAVDSDGRITGMGNGTAVVTAVCGDFTARCTVQVTGTLLPFTDVPLGVWYYSDLRYVYERKLISGVGGSAFDPKGTLTCAHLAQILYTLEGRPDRVGQEPVTAGARWYEAPLDWAVKAGILSEAPSPKTPAARLEIVRMLYRYETLVKRRPVWNQRELNAYHDVADLSAEDQEILRWAVGNGILYGHRDGTLRPEDTITRAQLAAILRRYLEK